MAFCARRHLAKTDYQTYSDIGNIIEISHAVSLEYDYQSIFS
jgi:hypothetical protein